MGLSAIFEKFALKHMWLLINPLLQHPLKNVTLNSHFKKIFLRVLAALTLFLTLFSIYTDVRE